MDGSGYITVDPVTLNVDYTKAISPARQHHFYGNATNGDALAITNPISSCTGEEAFNYSGPNSGNVGLTPLRRRPITNHLTPA